mmetsp:Transcript_130801/g.354988  ORF Transcript_130801/g.354988 Transcript_130801/m.354988 type:complete len:241 (+) Transcript_130801:678-1400(+)
MVRSTCGGSGCSSSRLKRSSASAWQQLCPDSSSTLSASSMATVRTRPRRRAPRATPSSSPSGVPTATRAFGAASAPTSPTARTAPASPHPAQSRDATCAIWCARSAVGASTRAEGQHAASPPPAPAGTSAAAAAASSHRRCRMGSKNTSVLPDPVSAAITSCSPSRILGMHCACTGAGEMRDTASRFSRGSQPSALAAPSRMSASRPSTSSVCLAGKYSLSAISMSFPRTPSLKLSVFTW